MSGPRFGSLDGLRFAPGSIPLSAIRGLTTTPGPGIPAQRAHALNPQLIPEIQATMLADGAVDLGTAAVVGDLAADRIVAGEFVGFTFTGGTFRTGTSGARIEMTVVGSIQDRLRLYGAGGGMGELTGYWDGLRLTGQRAVGVGYPEGKIEIDCNYMEGVTDVADIVLAPAGTGSSCRFYGDTNVYGDLYVDTDLHVDGVGSFDGEVNFNAALHAHAGIRLVDASANTLDLRLNAGAFEKSYNGGAWGAV